MDKNNYSKYNLNKKIKYQKLVRVYIYDDECKTIVDNHYQYDLVLEKDLKEYCDLNKGRLYDQQYFIFVED